MGAPAPQSRADSFNPGMALRVRETKLTAERLNVRRT